MPVFAIFSNVTEPKILAIFQTNIVEELILLLFIAGFFMITFSKEKDEKHCLRAVRIKAANQTILIYIFWLIFSIMFVFGNGFNFILVLNIILPFVIYLILFYSKKNKVLKKRRLRRLQYRILRPLTDLKKK
jgi:amino acid transporter